MEKNKYVLAMYDVRGKQAYIYKSNKIKEIMGASYIIRDCYNYLYDAADERAKKRGISPAGRIFSYKKSKDGEDGAFSRDGFENRLREGYIGEVVYDGGGDFFVLFKNIETYKEINKIFYRKVLEGTYSLRVLSSYIEGVNFDNFQEDQRNLYAIHRKNEQEENMIPPVNTLPIVQTGNDSLPLAEKQEGLKISYESKKKYEKYHEISNKPGEDIEGETVLDEMITEKGRESLLAVVYIDGNNMGAQKQACMPKDPSYEASVNALRAFSSGIQKNYIDDRITEIDKLYGKKRRFVVYAGDEITFICNARDAYRIAVEYLTKLYESGSADGTARTSCAGIAIFHSHAPFSEAYRIAEECCESGKKLMKENNISEASLLDFHYCQGAIGTSLEDIRKHEETEDISRPWFICGKEKIVGNKKEAYVTKEILDSMKVMLNLAGRSNVKDLLYSAKKSRTDFDKEIKRIKAHQKDKEIDFSLNESLEEEQQRKLIYDMMIVYDLWFSDKKTGE